MARVIILGSAYAIPDETHDNTHLAILAGDRTVLVDCTGNPIARLRKAGINPADLTDLVLTHFHPDHVSSAPLLMMDLWLMGRKTALDVYGLEHTLTRLETVMTAFDYRRWPGFYPLNFHTIPESEMAPVMDTPALRAYASPVHHLIPTIGLRFEFPAEGKVVAYSCDTEPCPEVVRLASGADVLIHEATGASLGHSSAEQAGEIARQAEAGRLVLVHYAVGTKQDPAELPDQARGTFPGRVDLGHDFMTLEL